MRTSTTLTIGLVYAALISSACASDLQSLRIGTFVAPDVPCSQASTSVMMNYDGEKFYGGRLCAVPAKGSPNPAFVLLQPCPGEDGENLPPGMTIHILGPSLIETNGFKYRFCEQAELDPGWRGVVPKSTQASTPKPAPPPTGQATICSVVNDWKDLGPEVRWRGECKDGKAEGKGTASWYVDGILTASLDYTGENGLLRKAGATIVVSKEIDKHIKLVMEHCSSISGSWVVHVLAPDSLALRDGAVIYYLGQRAIAFAAANCPVKAAQWFRVYTLDGKQRGIEYNNGRYENNLASNIIYEAQQTVVREKNRRAEAERARRAEEERQKGLEDERKAREFRIALEQAKAEARQRRRAKFVSANGVQEWATAAQVIANPFVYKNKVTAFPAQFVRMLSESEALFQAMQQQVVISKVPTTQFQGPEVVLVAARVRGTHDVKVGSVVLNTPDLQYVGAESCNDPNCADLLQQ